MNYFIFLVIFEELLDATMWLKIPRDRRARNQIVFGFTYKILDCNFIFTKKLHVVPHDVIFNVMAWNSS